ncbi:MAG: hypothetical protein QM728_11970 [Gordonia sp. (in: high G+C Gram-positive bacteria)]|uniref:hypothetical protein n=1 Tax=Gordonia sp. (in: high G+C Gram-positive bacteria) TaxID=84139 RepID=UPI0039E6ADD8
MMTQVIDHVSNRATATPRLTAARFGESAVSFGDLDKAVHDYQEVLHQHGLSDDAALPAAIMATLPDVSTGTNVVEIIDWLQRDLAPAAPATRLRAVG